MDAAIAGIPCGEVESARRVGLDPTAARQLAERMLAPVGRWLHVRATGEQAAQIAWILPEGDQGAAHPHISRTGNSAFCASMNSYVALTDTSWLTFRTSRARYGPPCSSAVGVVHEVGCLL